MSWYQGTSTMRGLLRGLCAGTAVIAITASMTAKAQTFSTTQTDSNVIAGNTDTVTVTNGATLTLTNANNSYRGGTVVVDGSTVSVGLDDELGNGHGAVTLGDPTHSGTLELTNTVAQFDLRNITLAQGGGIINATGTTLWTFGGVVSGTGLLTVDGPGTVALTETVTNGVTAANTNSGGIAILGGATLEVTADTALGAPTGGITLGNSATTGTLDLVGGGAITSVRDITLGSAGGVIDTSTAAASAGNSWTFTGVVSGSGPLTVGGNQTLVLDGINTYTGLTTVDHGTLQIGDAKTPTASLLPNTDTVVVSGGTLSGQARSSAWSPIRAAPSHRAAAPSVPSRSAVSPKVRQARSLSSSARPAPPSSTSREPRRSAARSTSSSRPDTTSRGSISWSARLRSPAPSLR